MAIDGIGSGASNINAGATRAKRSSDAPGGASGASTAQNLKSMFSKLQQLSQQNPGQFAKVTSDLASQFRDAAKNASGEDAARLTKLADGLDQASKSGNLSSMQPKKAGGHHHHAKAAPPPDAQATTAGPPDTGSSTVVSKAIDEIDKALAAAAAPKP